MTPEQRAKRACREIDGRGIWHNEVERMDVIVRALRAERNAGQKPKRKKEQDVR